MITCEDGSPNPARQRTHPAAAVFGIMNVARAGWSAELIVRRRGAQAMRWLRRMMWIERFISGAMLLGLAALLLPLLNPDNSLPAGLIVPSSPLEADPSPGGYLKLIFIDRHTE